MPLPVIEDFDTPPSPDSKESRVAIVGQEQEGNGDAVSLFDCLVVSIQTG